MSNLSETMVGDVIQITPHGSYNSEVRVVDVPSDTDYIVVETLHDLHQFRIGKYRFKDDVINLTSRRRRMEIWKNLKKDFT